jgi:hypothetical protein
MEILFKLNRIHKFLWILFCIIDTILHNHIQLTNLFYYFSIFNKNPIDNSRIYIILIQKNIYKLNKSLLYAYYILQAVYLRFLLLIQLLRIIVSFTHLF